MKAEPFLLAPGEKISLSLYRCPNCSVAFGLETTVAGPQHCPACGAADPPRTLREFSRRSEGFAEWFNLWDQTGNPEVRRLCEIAWIAARTL